MVICAKELRAQASHAEFWGNGRRDADPKRADWEFWVIKQVGFECCPHKRMEKSIAHRQKQSPGLASKDEQRGHNHPYLLCLGTRRGDGRAAPFSPETARDPRPHCKKS